MTTSFLTDKYELTMLQAALESGAANEKVTFELFARNLPKGRRYGVVGGISRAIEAVRDFTFTDQQLVYLSHDPIFKKETIDFLKNYSFKGEIIGYREGDLYFPYSPILTVKGTFADSVILETLLLSILNHDSAVMSAASRMVNATEGLFPLIEMGSRRTHEYAAVDAARAAYIAGFNATSNLEAGIKYNIPTTGTSAHAFTLAHATEKEAFQYQVAALGVSTTLLVDTYDIEEGIKNAIEVAGPNLGGIRIDSGDLHEEPNKARKQLDALGAKATKIIVSSDIDEYSINEIVERGTPVDGVGAGTRVVTGSGHPTAGMVFKIVEREDGEGNKITVAKKSSGKKSIGGFKKAYRVMDSKGVVYKEEYSLSEIPEEANIIPLQHTYVSNGVFNIPTIEESRLFHKEVFNNFPKEIKLTTASTPYLEANINSNEGE